MSIVELIIANLWVRLLDIITLGLRAKKSKITYISYTSDSLPENMSMISKKLKQIAPDCKEIYLTQKYQNTILDKVKYVFEIAKQIYHIKTSKVVIIDGNNFVISNINKKNTKVIQIWHAAGAIKKFGCDYDRKYPIKNYDYVITSSSTSKEIMASAFNMDEGNVIALGNANTDKLFNKNKMESYKEQMYEKYPFMKDKKVILYAPTFRGRGIYDKDFLEVDINKIGRILGDEYIVLYKLHPIISQQYNHTEDNIYNLSNESLYKLFSVSDILVSDFSSIIYDYTILEKPIILYTPDLKAYKNERGLYVDYESFAPGEIVYTEEELVKVIMSDNKYIDKVINLKNEFFDYKDGKSSERIAKFVGRLL